MNYSIREPLFLILFVYVAFILVVDPKRLLWLTVKVAREKRSAIGQIIGVLLRTSYILQKREEKWSLFKRSFSWVIYEKDHIVV